MTEKPAQHQIAADRIEAYRAQHPEKQRTENPCVGGSTPPLGTIPISSC
jgi:hypothetical protein